METLPSGHTDSIVYVEDGCRLQCGKRVPGAIRIPRPQLEGGGGSLKAHNHSKKLHECDRHKGKRQVWPKPRIPHSLFFIDH